MQRVAWSVGMPVGGRKRGCSPQRHNALRNPPVGSVNFFHEPQRAQRYDLSRQYLERLLQDTRHILLSHFRGKANVGCKSTQIRHSPGMDRWKKSSIWLRYENRRFKVPPFLRLRLVPFHNSVACNPPWKVIAWKNTRGLILPCYATPPWSTKIY